MKPTELPSCDGTCRPKCRECRLKKGREYTRANPHRQWINSYRSRARVLGFEPIVEEFTRADVIRTYGNHCAYCPTGEFEELDHKVPVCLGGPHTLANVRPSCKECNSLKSQVDGCPGDRWLR